MVKDPFFILQFQTNPYYTHITYYLLPIFSIFPITYYFSCRGNRGKFFMSCHPIEQTINLMTIMRKIDFTKVLISLMIIPFMLVSCEEDILPGIAGEGEIVTRTLDIDEFSGFTNSIAAEVYLTQGDEQSVIIEAQENIIDNLNLDRVRDGHWTIDFDRWVRRAKPIKIYITVPTLDKAAISGAGEIFGESYFENLDELELAITGAGNIELEFDCTDLDLVVSGTGSMFLEGNADKMNATISGAGGIKAFELQTERAEFEISGAGNGRLSVSDYLKVTISGIGNLYYRGTPETDVDISGSGNVMKD